MTDSASTSAARTAVVTGGTRGLGRALAFAFARRGYRVYATGREKRACEEVRRSAEGEGLDVIAIASDVSRPEENAKLVRAIAGDGRRVDVVVHNAGLIGRPNLDLSDYPPDVFRDVMAVNVFGPFDLTRQIRPLLAANSAILFVSSGASLGPRARWGAYNVSKIALDGLAGIWAQELAGAGVRVYVIDPGPTRTAMRAAAFPSEDPATLATPDERAGAFLWLAERGKLSMTGRRFRAEELPDRG